MVSNLVKTKALKATKQRIHINRIGNFSLVYSNWITWAQFNGVLKSIAY